MYKVWTTSFNSVVYEGCDPIVAMASAVNTGFECTMTYPGGTMTWSPIGGWRSIYNKVIKEEGIW